MARWILDRHDYLVRSGLDKALAELIGKRNDDGTVLDVGCGSDNSYCDLFTNHIGLDLDSGDIWGTGEQLPIKSSSIDTFLSIQVLEHVEDPKAFLLEAHRVLKTNGKIILSTHGTYPIHTEKDYWRWTDKGLRKLFESMGFNNVEVTPVGGYWLCLFQLINCAINMTCLKPLIPIFNVIGSLDLFKNKRMSVVYVTTAQKL